MGYPAWFCYVAGMLELAGAYMLYVGGELFTPGILLLQAVMGGAALTLLTSPAPPAAVMPAGFSWLLWWVWLAAGGARAELTAAATVAGVVGGLLLKAVGPSAPAKKKAS
jgi:hypothetical protein